MVLQTVTGLMTIRFIEYLLNISPEDVDLDEIKLKNLIKF